MSNNKRMTIEPDVKDIYLFLNMTKPAKATHSTRTKQMTGPMTILTTCRGSPVQQVRPDSESNFR